jgi:molecular chaperone HscB
VSDPFAILSVEPKFGLDLAAVESRHLELARALHPDRHAGASPAERRASLSRAIEVNESWRALRDPIRRAEALFRRFGLGEQVGETREPKPSPAFLMAVMEAREALDDAKASRSPEAVERALDRAKAERRAALEALGAAIDAAIDAEGGPDLAALARAIPLLGALRYATRFVDEAQGAADDLAGF